MTTWTIHRCEAGLRLPEAIVLRVPTAPIGFVRQLCKKQRVSIDDVTADADRIVHCGERVQVRPSARWQDVLEQSPLAPAQLLYEDADCAVLCKPSGVAVHHAGHQNDNLLDRLQTYVRLRGAKFRVAAVHRLDIGTSGAILFGKGKRATGLFGRQLMAGAISKRYLALVHGAVPDAGKLTAPVPVDGRLKPAFTTYRPISRSGALTLLELELVTGRRHQLRRQLAAAGWPIVGDRRYRNDHQVPTVRLMLHSHSLVFQELDSGAKIVVDCPPATDFDTGLQQCGFHGTRNAFQAR